MMSESETPTTLDQVNAVMVDVRNEAIVQSANAYLLGRKLVLASLGAAMLGIDTLQACAQRAIERGEIAEADTQRLASDLQQQAMAHVKAVEQARISLTETATTTIVDNLNGVLRVLRLSEIDFVVSVPPDQPSAEMPAKPGHAQDRAE